MGLKLEQAASEQVTHSQGLWEDLGQASPLLAVHRVEGSGPVMDGIQGGSYLSAFTMQFQQACSALGFHSYPHKWGQ